jgi:putative membrane protein
MMDGWHHGMDSGNWVIVMLISVVLLVMIVWLLSSHVGRGSSSEVRERPEEILDRRLAAGEIDAKTYDELKAKLQGSEKKP